MEILDYSKAIFKFQGFRPHFFRNKQYYITLFEDYFIMADTPDSFKPKYFIRLCCDVRLSWDLKKCGNNVQLNGFVFPGNNNVRKVIHAKTVDLIQFKKLIQLKVTFDGIGDLFKPLCLIGKGSSAKVYSATSVIDQKVFAIKSIEKAFLHKTEDGQGIMGFKTEVRILQKLAKYNEHFLTLIEIYEGDKTFYLVTQLLEGYSLNDEIERYKNSSEKRMPLQNVKQIMRKLFLNLTVLHSHNIIHRDLKPDNLMFAHKNDLDSLVLVDFGLATYETAEQYLFPKCGTPGYVAPEILTSQLSYKYNTKVDLFSAGCIFYKLLTGHSIFGGSNFEEVLRSNKKCVLDFNVIGEQVQNEAAFQLLKLLLNKSAKQRISAKEALNHVFFDMNGDFSTQVQITPRHNLINLQKIQMYEEQQSQYDSNSIINDEKDDDDEFIHRLPEMKRCSLISEIGLPIKNSQTFFHKEPLSTLKMYKMKGSPLKQ